MAILKTKAFGVCAVALCVAAMMAPRSIAPALAHRNPQPEAPNREFGYPGSEASATVSPIVAVIPNAQSAGVAGMMAVVLDSPADDSTVVTVDGEVVDSVVLGCLVLAETPNRPPGDSVIGVGGQETVVPVRPQADRISDIDETLERIFALVVPCLEDAGAIAPQAVQPVTSMISNSRDAWLGNHFQSGVNMLDALKNYLNAQSGKKISLEAAQGLTGVIDDVLSIMELLLTPIASETFKNFIRSGAVEVKSTPAVGEICEGLCPNGVIVGTILDQTKFDEAVKKKKALDQVGFTGSTSDEGNLLKVCIGEDGVDNSAGTVAGGNGDPVNCVGGERQFVIAIGGNGGAGGKSLAGVGQTGGDGGQARGEVGSCSSLYVRGGNGGKGGSGLKAGAGGDAGKAVGKAAACSEVKLFGGTGGDSGTGTEEFFEKSNAGDGGSTVMEKATEDAAVAGTVHGTAVPGGHGEGLGGTDGTHTGENTNVVQP